MKVVIPARYDSTRLPGKPLADLGGLPMVVRTARNVQRADVDEVVIATDDRRVVEAARDHGCDVEMTDPNHPSGTDRLMEVVEKRGWSDDHLVVNVQGDEPLVPADVLNQLNRSMVATEFGVGTLCERVGSTEELFNPNVVKVVKSDQGRALYFSRAPIPWHREGFQADRSRLPEDTAYYRHIGIYAYRASTLRAFVDLSQGMLERAESLEQLRLLQGGIDMLVVEACAPVPGGVDTPEDLEAMRALLAAGEPPAAS